ncbi:hypothetical protein [Actinoallomurus iriomotensis]|uniref:Uncharacterized protein n=1 Tax=Actinoallomurus iriomotensis TaxID=478107 RepID=A0A9W6RAU7_9ACTN|nr:hypothetical protein [Actinoallomurus iriomotensis]GLY72208.1 hypothetical protein Airi01_004750 [Actinoallomurus iriomotensis]
MGASSWQYFVPYQEDLQDALRRLRHKVFEERAYYWVKGADWRPEKDREPWPATIEELWEDEWVHESGTHSILDIFRVIGPAEQPDYNTVQPVSADEAFRHLGVRELTRAHVPEFDVFPRARWMGRCAVLHDDRGRPQEICFWGHSGD